MNLQKKLGKLGIENIRKLDNESIRIVANNVTEAITKSFPEIYDEYNNILIKLLSCNMYVANITRPIAKINYIYENNSIYFDDEINLSKVNEQMIHSCIHYLQDNRNKKGKLRKIGLCNFEKFSFYGLGLNEAAVQYISAKSIRREVETTEKYGVRLKTISKDYYPFLTNLIEQIIYLIGEESLIKGTLNIDNKIEDELLNTFEANTKKIISGFDNILDINNKLNMELNKENIEILKQKLVNTYIETQNIILSTYFDKICPKLTTIQEIDFYTDKAMYYKKMMGVILETRFSEESFFDKYIIELNQKFNKRLMEISKEEGRNTLAIITSDRITKFLKRVLSRFST